ncbi:MAG TPA: hypothetical protein ENH95_00550 [Nitrosopumilus sp.]|nr:hypothetical protein [Nitrosopumilus sp.]
MQEIERFMQIFITKIHVYLIVSEELAWKCFRCNLTFREEDVAKIHREISKHSVSKVKVLVV